MTDVNLGPLAETEFKRLCLHLGGKVTVHKSDMDRTGWDFLVEFPFEVQQNIPRDVLPSPLKCWVQVKGTDGNRKRASISLSNMHHLVKAQSPVFFCFIEFNSQDKPQAIYLVHVWEKIIARTLKRIRQNDAKSEPKELNKCTLDISYNDSQKLEQMTGKCLKQKIESYVPDCLEKYIQTKNRLLSTLGFENGRYHITYTVNEDQIESFVDATLQYSENKIPVKNLRIQQTRFGFLSHEKGSETGSTISFPKPPTSASIPFNSIPIELIFKDKLVSIGVRFPAEMFISPFHELIPDSYKKVRISSIFGDFFLKRSEFIPAKFSLSLYERLPLSTLRNLLSLLKMIEKQPNVIQFAIKRRAKVVTCCDVGDWLTSMFEHDVKGRFDLKRVARCIDLLTEIGKSQSDLEEQLLISLSELATLDSSGDFLLFEQAICSKNAAIALFSPKLGNCKRDSAIGYACSAKISVGNMVIVGCFGIIGHIHSDSNGHFLRSEDILIDDFVAIDSLQDISPEHIKQGESNLLLAMANQEFNYVFSECSGNATLV